MTIYGKTILYQEDIDYVPFLLIFSIASFLYV